MVKGVDTVIMSYVPGVFVTAQGGFRTIKVTMPLLDTLSGDPRSQVPAHSCSAGKPIPAPATIAPKATDPADIADDRVGVGCHVVDCRETACINAALHRAEAFRQVTSQGLHLRCCDRFVVVVRVHRIVGPAKVSRPQDVVTHFAEIDLIYTIGKDRAANWNRLWSLEKAGPTAVRLNGQGDADARGQSRRPWARTIYKSARMDNSLIGLQGFNA